mmetsp:Transcript_19942/g.42965  ORF Transcript_19942/g.42965 Transcript_19942/m.42965 type:complete len:184 (-) Transcript_19942:756-1307(-)
MAPFVKASLCAFAPFLDNNKMTTSGSYLVPIKTDSSASLNGMTKSGSAQMLAEKGVSLPRAHSSQLLATQQQDVELSGGIKLTWEPRVERMIRERFEAADHTPFMVGLVGIPGSGKSTSCDILASLLSSSSNGVDGEEEPISNIVIPMVSDRMKYQLKQPKIPMTWAINCKLQLAHCKYYSSY